MNVVMDRSQILFRSAWALFWTAMLVNVCHGEATVTAFSGSLGTPKYMSGTNCRIWGSAVVTGPPTSGFVGWKLFLNDTLVHQYTTEEGIVILQHMSMSVRTDSTYFQNGSTLIVRFQAQDEDGNWYDSPEKIVPVRNSILLAQHPDPDITGPPVDIVGALVHPPSFGQQFLYGA